MASMIKVSDFYVTGATMNNHWTPEKVQAIIDAANGQELLWETDSHTGHMVKARGERIYYDFSTGVLLVDGELAATPGIAYPLYKLGSVVVMDDFTGKIKYEAIRLHRERYYAAKQAKAEAK